MSTSAISARRPRKPQPRREIEARLIAIGAMLLIAMVFMLNPPVLRAQSGTRSSGSASRAEPLTQFNTQGLTVPRDQILSGGPPKDGIPALTNPKTIAVTDAPYRNDDRMVVVEIAGQVRAYPINVLNWHEAINDTLGDTPGTPETLETPITVIYCPLCDSVSVVDRRMGGQTLEFGISGLLQNSNVLLYDRTHKALWSQVGLAAISGPNAGKSLKYLPWQLTSFVELKKTHPKATVVTTETGHRRDYSRNPYASYFATDRLMFPVAHKDPRLKPKEPIVGVRLGQQVHAYPLNAIGRAPQRTIDERIDGQRLVLKMDEAGGVSVVEAPAEAQVVHTFWFAWSAFHPQTTVYGQKQPGSDRR
ncbi:MAG: DUF3179 domain-containing protein [Planctomycetes bacterium]|nr:DUF3179 domain-containing protein [Planctomycetota bacterium]